MLFIAEFIIEKVNVDSSLSLQMSTSPKLVLSALQFIIQWGFLFHFFPFSYVFVFLHFLLCAITLSILFYLFEVRKSILFYHYMCLLLYLLNFHNTYMNCVRFWAIGALLVLLCVWTFCTTDNDKLNFRFFMEFRKILVLFKVGKLCW